jgi:hypothetical protein
MPSPLSRYQGKLLCVALFAMAPFAPSCAEGKISLCRADEKVFFACSTGEKLVSVCASPDISATAGYVQFRYGAAENTEIAWPEARIPRQYVTKGDLVYAGAIGTYLRFKMDETSFVVFSASGKKSAQGLVVEKGGTVFMKRRCQSTSVSKLGSVPVPRADVFAVSGFK